MRVSLSVHFLSTLSCTNNNECLPILKFSPSENWHKGEMTKSNKMGHGSSWGTLRQNMRCFYFLPQISWNWLSSLTLATYPWHFPFEFTKSDLQNENLLYKNFQMHFLGGSVLSLHPLCLPKSPVPPSFSSVFIDTHLHPWRTWDNAEACLNGPTTDMCGMLAGLALHSLKLGPPVVWQGKQK